MPLFEFACRGCGRHFETLVTRDRHPVCPECHGEDLEKLLSTFAVSTKGSAPARPCADGACAPMPSACCGGGACGTVH
jgi:putative FmdB family regulatory protein